MTIAHDPRFTQGLHRFFLAVDYLWWIAQFYVLAFLCRRILAIKTPTTVTIPDSFYSIRKYVFMTTNESNSQQNMFTFRLWTAIYVDWLLHTYSLVNSKTLALRITHYAKRLNGQMIEKKTSRIDKPVKRCKVPKWKVRLFSPDMNFIFRFRSISTVKALHACIKNAWKSSHLLFTSIQ